MASEREAAIRSIRRAKKARGAANIASRDDQEELRKCCLDADRAGVPVTQIAKEAGLDRREVDVLISGRDRS
jgi:hypothetical protein